MNSFRLQWPWEAGRQRTRTETQTGILFILIGLRALGFLRGQRVSRGKLDWGWPTWGHFFSAGAGLAVAGLPEYQDAKYSLWACLKVRQGSRGNVGSQDLGKAVRDKQQSLKGPSPLKDSLSFHISQNWGGKAALFITSCHAPSVEFGLYETSRSHRTPVAVNHEASFFSPTTFVSTAMTEFFSSFLLHYKNEWKKWKRENAGTYGNTSEAKTEPVSCTDSVDYLASICYWSDDFSRARR